MSIGANGYAKLRPLEFRPFEQNGQPYILLRDPYQLADKSLLVPHQLAPVLTFCDGTRPPAEIAGAFSARYRIPLQAAAVEELLAALDDALLLDNARAAAAKQAALAIYRAAPHRPLLLADRGYPRQPDELAALLDGYLHTADVASRPRSDWPTRMGLLSPHIDYPRGGHVYAQIWKHAAEAARAAELVVIFGTDHNGDDPFTLTRQHYATPYGLLPTAQPVVDALANVVGDEAAFAGELRHRDEHAIELVAVWLHHMRGGQPVELVPILTGSLQRYMWNGATPGGDRHIEEMLATIDAMAAGKRLLIVASGDLAHVGPAFGGAPLTPSGRRQLRQHDETLIQAMGTGSSDMFFQAIRRDGNANNVCGVAPIYLTMRMLEQADAPRNTQQFGYATCPADEQNLSVVTVCGMTFS